MSSSNDLPDVAALLRELECSAAWQELKAANATSVPGLDGSDSANQQPHPVPPVEEDIITDVSMHPSTSYGTSHPISGSSVAALLSQLSSTTEPADLIPSTSATFGRYGRDDSTLPFPLTIPRNFTVPPTDFPVAAPENDRESIQHYSFRQSLPLLSELGDNPTLVAIIKKMKTDQDQLERELWADREAIFAKYQDKLKVAQTKAQMIGATVSQHEINMISDAFKKDISKFDNERVLPAWDGLVSRQQNELAQHSVPTMFVTSDMQDRETQQKVIGVLEGIAGSNRT